MQQQFELLNNLDSTMKTDKDNVGKNDIRRLSDEELSRYLSDTGSSVIQNTDPNYQSVFDTNKEFQFLFFKGDISLLKLPCVSIVGTRKPTAKGIEQTKRISEILIDLGFVVVSGLAEGIDTAAHKATLAAKGKTIAVMGTPIHKIYPAKNKELAANIFSNGLVISPALPFEEVGRYLFPRRNKLMANLSIATIIIEAGPTSGVVHQAAECLKQNKKLILLKSLAENKSLDWVPKFLKSGAQIVETPSDLKAILGK
jgi:DNA processing protein